MTLSVLPEEKSELWKKGLVSSWYLRDSQLDIYLLICRQKRPFIEAARRFGKTTSILAFVLEQLRRNPGWICRWCFPFKGQARDVLLAEMVKMQKNCPDHLKFQYHTIDSVFVGPKGSKLYIRGVNEDRGESARGPAANIIVADEYGFWVEPSYIIKEVLYPQLQNQEGRWLIKASTPPRDLGHIYYEEREEAARKGRFIQKTIMDNEALSPEELQEIIDECGGINSPSFRRERMCEAVSDPESLIIPEFTDENIVDDDYPMPQFFDLYVGGDSGADDNTAILFAWYDFIKNEIVVDQELVTNGQTTGNIVAQAKVIEAELWNGLQPHKRVYDADKQLIYDVISDHKWTVFPPRKEDRISAIHELRIEAQKKKFKVKRRCAHLIRQLKVGMWKDDRHLDFERSDSLGHLDAIAAAIYLQRAVDRTRNPVPAGYGFDPYSSFIPRANPELSKTEEALKTLFRPKRGIR